MTKSHFSANRQSSRPPAKEQRERFIEAARKAECSEDEAVFDETLKRIVKDDPSRAPKKGKG